MKARIVALMMLAALTLGVSANRDPVNNVRPVSFDVAVMDKDGNPVVGLQRRNFRVLEDGVEQPLTSFQPRLDALAMVIVAESTDVYYSPAMIKTGEKLIRNLGPEDWIALVSFDNEPEIVVDFTHDKAALVAGLRQLEMPYKKDALLYDALYFVLDRFNRNEGFKEKKALVVLGTGRDTSSRHSYGDVVKKAAASGTAIYTVGLEQSSVTVDYNSYEPGMWIRPNEAASSLRALSEATGGLSFFPQFGGQYDAIPQIVNTDLRYQYTLGFTSSSTKAVGKLRRLKVEVIGDKVRVRHQEGHYGN